MTPCDRDLEIFASRTFSCTFPVQLSKKYSVSVPLILDLQSRQNKLLADILYNAKLAVTEHERDDMKC